MEIELPFDFVVAGAPLSLAASSGSRERWKARIVETARQKLDGWEWQHMGPVAVAICHFPEDARTADADNIAKPIIDALKGLVFADDKQVERVLIRRIDPRSVVSLQPITAELQRAMEGEKPLVYVKVSRVPAEESL